jgi:phosphatidate cytidylyltransferase
LGAVVVLYPVSWWIAGKAAVDSLWMALAFGLVVTVVGILGDLGESLVKRELGHKDSGGLIPGMGGLLDVVDSIVAAAPVVYLFWNAGWIGPL